MADPIVPGEGRGRGDGLMCGVESREMADAGFFFSLRHRFRHFFLFCISLFVCIFAKATGERGRWHMHLSVAAAGYTHQVPCCRAPRLNWFKQTHQTTCIAFVRQRPQSPTGAALREETRCIGIVRGRGWAEDDLTGQVCVEGLSTI